MSKYDAGKHNVPSISDGRGMSENAGQMSKKRLDAQKPPKNLLARIAGYETSVKSADAKLRTGFNKPGSQQRRSK